ncbi:Serine/threonine-protein kinase Rio1 [Sodiomyces alkalinus F11]|uniref:Serine/threonine-protein kinase RIO1 n=1 Tax=Sodiomyces alkalinus (strain CBS 110278 / VKM F-3762 / F11) TaxID=1314773 RepID=A0A3N2PUZ6_SODAK|nr:Serine/threonine-protein kinase Rio1 [Sodiomyces alkalinus F11]ROT38166.1 Serine/threonine-protein kinase Rio1 [Sodiomyces alkalinus F11]
MASTASPSAPPYTYTANRGYESTQDALSKVQQSGEPPVDPEEDGDINDIFEDDEVMDDDWRLESGDLTKSYNRQRMFRNANESSATATATATATPRSNAQKPTANTFASVDDQVAALSKHAAKIRLDSVKAEEERTRDKADRATTEQVLDQRTRMILLQMINRGIVSEVHGTISTGKEANVYHAVLQADDGPAVQRAIKVYKTSIMVFKDRERYIAGEYRFQKGYDKSNSRKMVKLWAEKEFRNMRRIYTAGIPCPEPVHLKLHVLAMSFLGDRRGWAYPRLRDAVLAGDDTDQQWRTLYVQLLGIMRRLYRVCRLVHADLSEYNVLYNEGTLYIIDVSQSVEPDHPRALEFLRMDIKNVGDFFRRKGVDTLTDRVIFDFVTSVEGPTEEPGLSEAIERLYETRGDEAAADDAEVDNEVFRNQYIPQTLQQVYDIEKDGQRIEQGEGGKLVYKNLLAENVVDKKEQQQEDDEEDDESEEDESGSGADLSSEDESKYEKGKPRGKKHGDKEEKKLHKQAVKEAKREKRKTKIPKHIKKKMVSESSRKHK